MGIHPYLLERKYIMNLKELEKLINELNKYQYSIELLDNLKHILTFSICEESAFGKFYLIISDINFSIRKEISERQYKLFARWLNNRGLIIND